MELLFLVQCSGTPTQQRKEQMMSENPETWVVYQLTGKNVGIKAVCEKIEWDAMEKAKPGLHLLIQGGIGSETEAELLARGVSGNPKPRTSKLR
jgi:hypothetical protein